MNLKRTIRRTGNIASQLAYDLGLPMPLGMRIRAARRGSEHKVALIAPDLSFVYVPVPKAANSSIKYTLMRIQGVERGKADLNALHADTRTNLNASGLTQKLYNERLAALVVRRYREDFKIFEYDVESWRDF